MSDRSDNINNSDEEKEEEPEQKRPKKVNPAKKFCCFITEYGQSLNFVLICSGLDSNEVDDIKSSIETHMGTVSTNLNDVESYCAVLVSDKISSWNYTGDVFKVCYIHDCISTGRLLNISSYLKKTSTLFVENFDYMNIIYFRKYSWKSVPDLFRLPKSDCFNRKKSRKDDSDSDVLPDSPDSVHSTAVYFNDRKNTFSSYTRSEKEAMLRYVVERNQYNFVKGKRLYKDMEKANICPIRTWQSMRDHFQRSLSKEISLFLFLTSEQKQKLKTALLPK